MMQTFAKQQALSATAILVLLFAGIGLKGSEASAQATRPVVQANLNQSAVGDLWSRTELYFGSAKPDGSYVPEMQFRQFVDKEVTPRFPDGLTLLTGYGQYKGSDGQIAKEQSFVLVLLYPKLDKDTNAKIEAIRLAYKKAFNQESVLRVDEGARVSF